MLLLSPSPSRSLAQLVVMLFPIAASVSFVHGVVMAHSPVSHEFTEGIMENPDVRVTRGANPATLRQSPSDDNARLVANDEHDEDRAETAEMPTANVAAVRASIVECHEDGGGESAGMKERPAPNVLCSCGFATATAGG